MYLRTVFRSMPLCLAIADTDRPCRCKCVVYRQRGAAVEPVFGQMKDRQDAKRFSMRGLELCRGEWQLQAAVHNLRKPYRETVRRTETPAKVRIPTLSGRAFQLEAGHHSGMKPASIPINIRPL